MKYFALITFFICCSVSAELVDCKDGVGQFGNLGSMRYQIGAYSDGKCFVSVGPNNRYPEYRSFNFDSTGELMVFNSLGPGRPSTDTGARNYFFPIIKTGLKFELDKINEYIKVQTTDGRLWIFDAKSSKIESISDMDFDEDPDVNRGNQGGLSLSPKSETIIDEGWRLGGPPNILLERNSTILDSFGQKCVVKNKKLFKLELDNNGGVNGAYFIFTHPKDWLKFLKNNCKHLGI